MTESEWLACTEPQAMLDWLRQTGKGSDRKVRLFAVACCRRIWHLLSDSGLSCGPQLIQALATAECFADHGVGENELRTALEDVQHHAVRGVWDVAWGEEVTKATAAALRPGMDWIYAEVAAQGAAEAVREDASYDEARAQSPRASYQAERVGQATAIRDIFGNPFRPTPQLDPAWRTASVLSIAERLYRDRAFDRLPDLAAALKNAGCRDTDLLAHLQGAGPHVRGCWALDLVLGRS